MWRYLFLGLAMFMIGRKSDSKELDNYNKSDSKICEPIRSNDTPEEMLNKQLDSLIGLKNVKKQVYNLINFVKVQQMKKDRNLKCSPISLHMAFSGNPGTGKTIVARILSQHFYRIGLCKTNAFIEVDRSSIVQQYIGHTEKRVNELFDKASGGVLFIDEVHALSQSDELGKDFGLKAIDTMVKLMEDRRNEVIVIVAGYPNKLPLFFKSNPGLNSRFPFRISFEDYSDKELYSIFCFMANTENLKISKKCKKVFYQVLKKSKASIEEFGNARGVRNIFEKVMLLQANRVAKIIGPTDEELFKIEPDDLKCLLDVQLGTEDEKIIGFKV